MNDRRVINFKQGWEIMQKGITKVKNELPEPQISSEDHMLLYTTIFDMCTQKPPHNYSQQLYDKYRKSFKEYITSTVFPSLREKNDEFMLRELVKRWTNHKIMVRCLSGFFHYLDRYFIAGRSLPPLNEVGLTCFRDLVYQKLKPKVRDAVISLIDQEREGEQIDRALLKNVLDIFVEIRMGQMDHYENDFEADMLKRTAAYYSDMLKRTAVYYSQIFEQHDTAEGTALVKQAEDAASNKKAEKKDVVGLQEQVFVRKVIELHEKYIECIKEDLESHTLVHKALKLDFQFCQELKAKVRDAVLSLIDQEREGEQIDQALLKKGLDIFVEIGMGQMDQYENDFEADMLKHTAAYYSRKASNWILEDSCPDYMLKAEECLKQEKDRVSHYLHSSSEPKLLEKVQHELLSVYATQLLEKEHSGCHALLRDDKVPSENVKIYIFVHWIDETHEGVNEKLNLWRKCSKGAFVVPDYLDRTSFMDYAGLA